MKKLAAAAAAVFPIWGYLLLKAELSGGAACWGWGTFLAALGLFSFLWFLESFRRYRLLEDTPTAKIASAPQGYVEIDGLAENLPGKSLKSPLSLQPCVWFRYSVQEKQGSGKNERWVTIDSGESVTSFLVKDGTGEALVLPAGADIAPAVNRSWSGNTPSPASEVVPTGSTFFSGFGRYRYHEELLAESFPVHVAGWFETIQPSRDTEKELNEKLRSLKADPEKLKALADRDGDGQISVEEWDALRARLRGDLIEANARRPVEPAVNTMMIPADNSLPFIISGKGEEGAVSLYRWWSLAGALGFLTAGAGCVFLLKKVVP
jgi:hypothetical protein